MLSIGRYCRANAFGGWWQKYRWWDVNVKFSHTIQVHWSFRCEYLCSHSWKPLYDGHCTVRMNLHTGKHTILSFKRWGRENWVPKRLLKYVRSLQVDCKERTWQWSKYFMILGYGLSCGHWALVYFLEFSVMMWLITSKAAHRKQAPHKRLQNSCGPSPFPNKCGWPTWCHTSNLHLNSNNDSGLLGNTRPDYSKILYHVALVTGLSPPLNLTDTIFGYQGSLKQTEYFAVKILDASQPPAWWDLHTTYNAHKITRRER